MEGRLKTLIRSGLLVMYIGLVLLSCTNSGYAQRKKVACPKYALSDSQKVALPVKGLRCANTKPSDYSKGVIVDSKISLRVPALQGSSPSPSVTTPPAGSEGSGLPNSTNEPPGASFRSCSIGSVVGTSAETFEAALSSTLFSMNSSIWDGYIDFAINNTYLTQFGKGRWSAKNSNTITLKNSYDRFRFELSFSPDGRHYEGYRYDPYTGDQVAVSGDLLCAKYAKDLVVGDSELEQALLAIYREVHMREPDTAGFEYWLNLLKANRVTLDYVLRAACNCPEYIARLAEGGAPSARCNR